MEDLAFVIIVFVAAVFPLILFRTVEICHINGKTYVDTDVYYGSKALVLNIVTPVMLLIFLWNFRTKRFKPRTNIFLLLFVVWAFISALASPYKMNSLFGWPFRWQGAVTYFMYFVLYSFVLTFLKPEKVKTLLYIIYASAVIIAVYGILEYYQIEPLKGVFFSILSGDPIDGEIRSTIGNRNFFGSYMILVSLTTVFTFLSSTDRRENIINFILSIIFFAGIVASLTRGVWLGLTAAFFIMVLLMIKHTKVIFPKVGLLLLTFVVITTVMTLTGNETPLTRINKTESDIQKAMDGKFERLGSGRLYIYKRTLNVLLDKPVLGTGPDNLAYFLTLTEDESQKYFGRLNMLCIDKAHSEYLEYSATMGVPGLLLYLCFISFILLPNIRKANYLEPSYLGILSGTIGYLFQAAFNIGVISVLPLVYTFWAILHMCSEQYEY